MEQMYAEVCSLKRTMQLQADVSDEFRAVTVEMNRRVCALERPAHRYSYGGGPTGPTDNNNIMDRAGGLNEAALLVGEGAVAAAGLGVAAAAPDPGAGGERTATVKRSPPPGGGSASPPAGRRGEGAAASASAGGGGGSALQDAGGGEGSGTSVMKGPGGLASSSSPHSPKWSKVVKSGRRPQQQQHQQHQGLEMNAAAAAAQSGSHPAAAAASGRKKRAGKVPVVVGTGAVSTIKTVKTKLHFPAASGAFMDSPYNGNASLQTSVSNLNAGYPPPPVPPKIEPNGKFSSDTIWMWVAVMVTVGNIVVVSVVCAFAF